jgi:hypothetical protein
MRPPHWEHFSTFTPKVRRSNSAHLMYRHLRPVFCGFGGLLDAGAAESAAGAGAAAPSAGAAGITRGRQCAAGASTPPSRVVCTLGIVERWRPKREINGAC